MGLGLAAKKYPKRTTLLLVVILGLSFLTVAQGGTAKDARTRHHEGHVTRGRTRFEGTPDESNAIADLLSLLKIAPSTRFSAVRVRDSLQALFDSGRVANARVEVYRRRHE